MERYDVDHGLRLLRGLPELRGFTDERLRPLAQALEFQTIADGTHFIEQGSRSDHVYFVFEGEVDVSADGPEVPREGSRTVAVKKRLRPDAEDGVLILGLIGLIERGPRTASCTAVGPIRVARLSRDAAWLEMQNGLDVGLAFRYALARQLVEDARGLNAFLAEKVGATC